MSRYQVTLRRGDGETRVRMMQADGGVDAAFDAIVQNGLLWRVVGCVEMPDIGGYAMGDPQGRLL